MKRTFAALALALSVLLLANCGGGGSSGNPTPIINDTTPALYSISPTSVTAYSGSFTLLVVGDKFQPDSVILWEGRQQQTQYIGRTSLSAVIPSEETYTPRTVSVQVRGADAKVSSSVTFTVQPQLNNPVPGIFSTEPANVTAGGPAFTLAVNGYNFTPQSKIYVNGTARTTAFVSTSRLTTEIPATDIAQPTTLSIYVFNPAPGGGTSSSKDLPVLSPATKLSLSGVRNMVYDPTRQKIYATVSDGSVTVIDPVAGTLGTSLPLTGSPNQLAISDDGQFLYVILEIDRSIQRIALATMTPDMKFQATGSFGTNNPTSVSVMPGNPHTVAIAAGGEVGIYDDGVRRTNFVNYQAGSLSTVVFGASPDTLYAHDNTTSQLFKELAVDSGGVTVARDFSGRLPSGNFFSDSGFLFDNLGYKFDPSTGFNLGRFPLQSSFGCFTSDARNSMAYSLDAYGELATLTAYDIDRFVPISSIKVQSASDFGCKMITWGTKGIAFATYTQVVMVSAVFPPAKPLSAYTLDSVPANHLLYDRAKNKIYASVQGKAGTIGNSVVTINPTTSAIESSIHVGSEPNVMAMSDDGKTLYVGLDEADSVRKVDLSTGVATDTIRLYRAPSDHYIKVASLAVMPGSPNTFAVSRSFLASYPNRQSDIAIYDGSAPRPNTVDANEYYTPVLLAFGASSNSLLGIDKNSGVAFYRFTVDPAGLALNSRTVLENNSPQVASIAYHAGRLYLSSGAVVDTNSGTLVGFARGLQDVRGLFLDPPANRMYFLEYAGRSNMAVAFDMTSLLALDYLDPGQSRTDTFDHDLVILGSSTFAYASSNSVIITPATLQPIPVLNIATTQLPSTAVGKRYDFTLYGSSSISSYLNWTVDPNGGPLPPGLQMENNGRITGIVGNVATETPFTFTANVVTTSVPPAFATRNFTILVKTGSLGSNGTCATATPVSYGSFSGSISPYGDVDVYSFPGTKDDRITITAYASYSSSIYGGLDTVIELLDANCNRLAINDDANSYTLDSAITNFVLPSTGKYYVRIVDFRGDGRPDFQYVLSVKP